MNLEMSILTEAVPIPEKLLHWFTHHCLLYMEYTSKSPHYCIAEKA